MKLTTLYILLAAFFMQHTANVFILINFKLNQTYISKNLCENRKKPKMKCNGKCHLRKLLNKQQQKERSLPSLVSEKQQPQINQEKSVPTFLVFENIEKLSFTYLIGKTSIVPIRLFRPPEIVC